MNKKIAKKLSDLKIKRKYSYNTIKARKNINSNIKEAILNGKYSTTIHLGYLIDELDKVTAEQENYYKNKGFEVEIKKLENEYYSTRYYMKISWDN